MPHVATQGSAIEGLIASVACARPRLLDRWEAAALIESFGYTDTRLQREFGFPDSLALGSFVYEALRDGPGGAAPSARPGGPSAALDLLNSVSASIIYAVPWLALFVIERSHPAALRLPGAAGPPLSLALMMSLVVSGGFVQAIARRGQFYIGIKQPGLGSIVGAYLFRLGAQTVLAAAAAGIAVAAYFELFAWPYIVLAADYFILLTLLWMTCAVITVRQQQWRVPLAFAAGAAAFVLLRASGKDVLMSQFLASGAVLAATLAQASSVFADDTSGPAISTAVPMPRMPVVAYRLLPFFWYGCAYFCFLFADRFSASASVAALTGAPFGMRPDYKLGMDVALLTFLFASAGVEYANRYVTRRLLEDAAMPYDGDPSMLRARISRIHRGAVAITVSVFVLVATAVGLGIHRLWPDLDRAVWTTIAIGDAGYLVLSAALLNGLVLFSLNRPWHVVRAFTAGLMVNLSVGYILSHVFNTYFAAAGLVAGALVVAAYSFSSVARTLVRADRAIAGA
jgi:hypothetical protein